MMDENWEEAVWRWPAPHVRHMKTALDQLVRHRRGIQAGDWAPGHDEATFWLTTVGSYSLLEQCLKLLVGVRNPSYLSSKRAKGTAKGAKGTDKRDVGTDKGDRHKLGVVYGKIEGPEQDVLNESYAQYASFNGFLSEFPTLTDYLEATRESEEGQEGQEGQLVWRYFLLDRDISGIWKLPSPPLFPDMLLEVIRSALDILAAWPDDEMQMDDVCRRLAEGLKGALYDDQVSDGPSPDDVRSWARDDREILNAFSRYLRAGPLDDYPNAMRKWLDHAVQKAEQMAEQNDDLARFLWIARRCCVTVNDNSRFSFKNHRPKPLFGGQSLDLPLDLPLDLRDGWSVGSVEWSVEWRTDKTTWRGAVDAIRELPVRVGQKSTMRWRRCRKPSQTDFVENTQGQLTVRRTERRTGRRHEHELMSLNVRILTAWPRGPKGTRVDHALFVVVDAGGNWPSEECDLACQACRGTGFCKDCRGESAKLECRTCSPDAGICPQCLGHGRDGDHVIHLARYVVAVP